MKTKKGCTNNLHAYIITYNITNKQIQVWTPQ